MTVLVYAAPSSPIGVIEGYVLEGNPTVQGYSPSPIGAPQGVVSRTLKVQGWNRSPIGAIRSFIRYGGDNWSRMGLPHPRMTGYEYHRDAGLNRTDMMSGLSRQRRRWLNGRRIATVALELDTSLLHTFEVALDGYGYNWFNMPMVTGDNQDMLATLHMVRVIDKPTFSELYGATITVSLTIELMDAV